MSKAEEAVEKAINQKMSGLALRFFRTTTTVCITATLAMGGLLWTFGGYLYEHHEATKAAIDTFIEVKKRHE